ncbi:chorismate mutase [Actinocrinis sp.]|uniref:chorismate mutase n=1 Tax=Actinocrinis sp. TaxID=1920516 RepID=UPI002D47154F|nr:chorismate mutase [Actinocrinis sp.]HZP52018.1 chorismate mutase [Actinocrinis sp.]
MTATELSPQSPASPASHAEPAAQHSAVPGSAPSPAEAVASEAAAGPDGLGGADGPEGVLSGRERIDALDAQIAALVQRRIDVSRQIQAARIADGGRRVDLRRETEIIARYSATLGRPGTAIAMALLELGRGRA